VSVKPQAGLVITTVAGIVAATLGLAGVRFEEPPPEPGG